MWFLFLEVVEMDLYYTFLPGDYDCLQILADFCKAILLC